MPFSPALPQVLSTFFSASSSLACDCSVNRHCVLLPHREMVYVSSALGSYLHSFFHPKQGDYHCLRPYGALLPLIHSVIGSWCGRARALTAVSKSTSSAKSVSLSGMAAMAEGVPQWRRYRQIERDGDDRPAAPDESLGGTVAAVVGAHSCRLLFPFLAHINNGETHFPPW